MNRQIGNRKGEGHVLNNLGNLYSLQKNYEQSISYFMQAEQIARQIGNLKSLAQTVGNRGIDHWTLGQYEDALGCFQEAVNTAKEIGFQDIEEFNLGFIASVYAKQQKYEQAIRHYREAIAINRSIGNARREGIVRGNLGLIYIEQAAWESAEAELSQALSLCLDNAPPAFGAFSASMAWVQVNQGRPLDALLALVRANPMSNRMPSSMANSASKARIFCPERACSVLRMHSHRQRHTSSPNLAAN